MKMCHNRRVLIGLALAALAPWTLAPNLVAAAPPVLILAACPLSMLLTMRGARHRMSEPCHPTHSPLSSDK
jgi:hypothetical protein